MKMRAQPVDGSMKNGGARVTSSRDAPGSWAARVSAQARKV
jgi:hypothetical protein